MKDLKKYEGIIPAFYACYDRDGKINQLFDWLEHQMTRDDIRLP